MLLSLKTSGQELRVSTDTAHYVFGDLIKAELELTSVPEQSQITALRDLLDSVNSKSGESLGNIEVLNQSPWRFDQGMFRSQLELGAFDTGHQFFIYPIAVDNAGTADTLLSAPAYFYVQPVQIDSTGLAPIKDIIEEPLKLEDFLPYLWGFGGVLLLALLGWWVYQTRKRKGQDSTVVKAYIPPHEIALNKLDELQNKKLWQQEKYKSFQSELTFILREYIEKSLSINALEMTSNETIDALKTRTIKDDKLRDLSTLFNIADLVKFAKGVPEANMHVELMDKARDFIHHIYMENRIMVESTEEE